MTDFMFKNGQSLDAGLYDLGQELMETGDLSSAIRVLRVSSETNAHYKTLELLGECLIEIGKARSAIIPLAASVTLSKLPRPAYLLAKAYWVLEEYEEAKQFAELSLSRSPAEYSDAQRLLDDIDEQAGNGQFG